MFFELEGNPTGRWDAFSARTVGLAVQRKMAAEFDGDATKMRRTTAKALAKTLAVHLESWNAREQWAFSNFAVTLSLVQGVARWTSEQKRSLVAVIRAKAGPDETEYLKRLQQHHALRDALLRIGNNRFPAGKNPQT